MTTTTEVSAMNKAQIIAELENMIAARLFSGQPWLADRETVYETATTFAPSAASQSKTMRYYDLKKNWRQKYRRVGAPESVDAGDESR